MFLQNIQAYTKPVYPFRSIKLDYRNRKSWLTPDLDKSIRLKKWIVFEPTPSTLNVDRYKEYKTILNTLTELIERQFYDEQVKASLHI